MDAELSRLLARAIQSVVYRREGASFAEDMEIGDRSLQGLQDWLIEQAIAAYSIEKLSPPVRAFLEDCDRSWQVAQELFAGKPAGEWDDDQVWEAMWEEVEE